MLIILDEKDFEDKCLLKNSVQVVVFLLVQQIWFVYSNVLQVHFTYLPNIQ